MWGWPPLLPRSNWGLLQVAICSTTNMVPPFLQCIMSIMAYILFEVKDIKYVALCAPQFNMAQKDIRINGIFTLYLRKSVYS